MNYIKSINIILYSNVKGLKCGINMATINGIVEKSGYKIILYHFL